MAIRFEAVTAMSQYLDSDESWGLGYTPAMRLAFLRQDGIDPIDLVTPSMALYHSDLRLPFFPEAGPIVRRAGPTARPRPPCDMA